MRVFRKLENNIRRDKVGNETIRDKFKIKAIQKQVEKIN